MYTPHDATLIHCTQFSNGARVFNITYLYGVLIEYQQAAALDRSGLQASDTVTMYVSKVSTQARDPENMGAVKFLEPAEYNKLVDKTGFWTMTPAGKNSGEDCYFVHGIIPVVDSMDYETLKKNGVRVFRVQSVNYCDYGTPMMRHWQVGGR